MTLLTEASRLHDLETDTRRLVALREADTIPGGRGTIYDQADLFRRRLDRLETAAISTVLAEWARIRAGVDAEIARLDRLIKAGDDLTAAVRAARDRLAVRRQAIVERVDSYARAVQASILTTQTSVAGLAQDETTALVGRQLGPNAAAAGITFDRLPADVVEQMLGQLRRGPLRDLLAALGPDLHAALERELVDGLAFGRNPRDIARRMWQAGDIPRWRALTIARTETLRAYRETHRRTMMANRDVIDGVTWVAKLDSRTCLACWDMHGSQHPPEYTMASHPVCRCALIPRTKSWAELGIPGVEDTPSLITTDGPTLFAAQPDHVQRAVLGPGRFELYKAGTVSLDDMVGFRVDPQWGPTSFVRPLAELIPPAAA